MKAMKHIHILLFLFAISIYSYAADTVYVGVKESPPFIMKTADGYNGISIELWNKIAEKNGYTFEYVYYPSLKTMINDVEGEELDLCIAPLTVTSNRIQDISFSLPIYISNIGIATVANDENSVVIFMKNLFSPQFIKAVGLLFLVIFSFGFVLWLFERKKNPNQFRAGIHGVWDGIWWSAVTMTTVGYGDKSPASFLGRIVALIWMFTAIIIISSFTASIASSLTVNQLHNKISTLDDLKKYNIGTVEKSSTNERLSNLRLKHKLYPTADMLVNAVENGEIDFAIYDEPILKYLVNEKGLTDEIQVFSPAEIIQYYSFSAPKKSRIFDQINPVIIETIESREWRQILNEYYIY